jgi:hypothetical protein
VCIASIRPGGCVCSLSDARLVQKSPAICPIPLCATPPTHPRTTCAAAIALIQCLLPAQACSERLVVRLVHRVHQRAWHHSERVTILLRWSHTRLSDGMLRALTHLPLLLILLSLLLCSGYALDRRSRPRGKRPRGGRRHSQRVGSPSANQREQAPPPQRARESQARLS